MPATTEQAFLKELDKKRWTAADPCSGPGLRRHRVVVIARPKAEAMRSGSFNAAVYKPKEHEAALRDTLLPKLMRGEVRVKEFASNKVTQP